MYRPSWQWPAAMVLGSAGDGPRGSRTPGVTRMPGAAGAGLVTRMWHPASEREGDPPIEPAGASPGGWGAQRTVRCGMGRAARRSDRPFTRWVRRGSRGQPGALRGTGGARQRARPAAPEPRHRMWHPASEREGDPPIEPAGASPGGWGAQRTVRCGMGRAARRSDRPFTRWVRRESRGQPGALRGTGGARQRARPAAPEIPPVRRSPRYRPRRCYAPVGARTPPAAVPESAPCGRQANGVSLHCRGRYPGPRVRAARSIPPAAVLLTGQAGPGAADGPGRPGGG